MMKQRMNLQMIKQQLKLPSIIVKNQNFSHVDFNEEPSVLPVVLPVKVPIIFEHIFRSSTASFLGEDEWNHTELNAALTFAGKVSVHINRPWRVKRK